MALEGSVPARRKTRGSARQGGRKPQTYVYSRYRLPNPAPRTRRRHTEDLTRVLRPRFRVAACSAISYGLSRFAGRQPARRYPISFLRYRRRPSRHHASRRTASFSAGRAALSPTRVSARATVNRTSQRASDRSPASSAVSAMPPRRPREATAQERTPHSRSSRAMMNSLSQYSRAPSRPKTSEAMARTARSFAVSSRAIGSAASLAPMSPR